MTTSPQTLDVAYPDYDGSQPCAAMNPELFFPRTTTNPVLPEVKAACARCPFLRPCLMYSLATLVDGFWGGTTPEERTQLRVKHNIAPKALTFRTAPSLGDRITALERAGFDRVEIAQQLGISPGHVDHHIRYTDGRTRA